MYKWDYDRCYECRGNNMDAWDYDCRGYGDDYYYNEYGELICRCQEYYYNESNRYDDWD